MAAGIISFFIGALAVLQGGLNRQITKSWSLPSAIFLNSCVFLVVAAIFWMFCIKYPQFIPGQNLSNSQVNIKWWWVIPGVCGFCLVAGIPWAIPRLGAMGVFLCIVVGQMFFSLMWDISIEQIPLEPKKLLGVGLALVGLFINWKA